MHFFHSAFIGSPDKCLGPILSWHIALWPALPCALRPAPPAHDSHASDGRGSGVNDPFTEQIAQRVGELLRPQFEARQAPARPTSIEAVATYLGRTPAAVRHMVAGGVLRAVRIDDRVMLDLQDLELLIKSAKS